MNEFYTVDGKLYEVAPNRKEEFLAKFPNAVLKQDEAKTTGVGMSATAPMGLALDTESNLEAGSLESQETNEEATWVEEAFGKNFVTDYFGDLYRGLKAGYRQSTSVDEAFDLLSKGSKASEEEIQKFIEASKYAQEAPVSDEMQEFQRIYEEEGGGLFGFLKGTLKTRGQVLPQVFMSSIGTMVGSAVNAPEVLAAGVAGAGAGAGVGLAAAGVGAIPGAVTGLVTGISGAMESGLTFAELIQDDLAKEGKEFTKENIAELLQDEEKYKSLRNRAVGRGVTIGAVEGIGNALSGGAFKGFKSATALAKVGKVAGGAAVEGVAGGLGEVAGRVVAGQEMDAAEIGFEATAGLAGTPISLIRAASTGATYKVNGENVSRQTIEEIINSDDGANINTANIEIKNDQELANLKQEKRDKYLIREAVKDRITDKADLETYVDAEFKKARLESKKNKNSFDKNDLKQLNTQLSSIYEKYGTSQEETAKGVVGVLTEEQKGAVKSSVDFGNQLATFLGLEETQTFDTADEFYKASGITREEGKAVGGVFKDGKILINVEEAAGTFQINVGVHEVLHPIFNSQIGDAKAQGKIVSQFKKTLTRAQRRDMERIMQRRGYGDQTSDRYNTEYLNVYSDALAKNELSTDKTTLERIGEFLRKFFKQYDITIGFASGQQVKNFMEELHKSSKDGKASEALLAAIDKRKVTKESIKLTAEEQKSQEELNRRVDELVGPKDAEGNYTVTNQEYQNRTVGDVYQALVYGDLIDPLIRKGIEGDAVYGKPIENFIEDVKMKVAEVISRFKPEDNNSLIGFINKQLKYRKQEVMEAYRAEAGNKSFDVDEGEVGFARDIAEETTFDEFDIETEEFVEDDTSGLIDPRKMLEAPDQLVAGEGLAAQLKMTEEEVNAFNEFNLEEAIENVDLAQTTLANTPRLFDYAVALAMGINPKKIFSTKVTLTSAELKTAQEFIYNNIDKIIALLPEGSTDKATGKALDAFLNKGMNLPKNILNAFYTKQDRISDDAAGLYPFKRNSNIRVADALQAFGMDPDGQKIQGVSTRTPEAQTIKALATLLSKLATNTHLRELVRKTDSDPMALVNLSEGKSEFQLSVERKTVDADAGFMQNLFNNDEEFQSILPKAFNGLTPKEAYEESILSKTNHGIQVFDLVKVEKIMDMAEQFLSFLPPIIFAKNVGLAKSMAGLHYRETYQSSDAGLATVLDPSSMKSFEFEGQIVETTFNNELTEGVDRVMKLVKKMDGLSDVIKNKKGKYSPETYVKIKDFVEKYGTKTTRNGKTEYYLSSLEPNDSGFVATVNRNITEGKIEVAKQRVIEKAQNNQRNTDLLNLVAALYNDFFTQNNSKEAGIYAAHMTKSAKNITGGLRSITNIETRFLDLIESGEKVRIEHMRPNFQFMFDFFKDAIIKGNKSIKPVSIEVLPKSVTKSMDNAIGRDATTEAKNEYLKEQSEAQFSFETKEDLDWDVFVNDDSYQAFASFKNRGVDYEIALTKNRTFDYDPFEGTYGIAEGTIENDKKSVTLSFSENIEDEDGDTQMIYDVTGRGKRGDVNPYEVFSIVANGTVDIVKRDNLNSITFTAKEDNRARLYEIMARRFAKELGWDIYSFKNITEFGEGSTVFLVYNSEEIFKNSDIRQDEMRGLLQFSSEVNDNETRMAGILSNLDKRYTVGQVLDRATARNLAARRAKRRDILAPSADDFVGLLYRFLDKGKLGEEQYKFFEEKLIKPFAKAYYALNAKRQTVTRAYKRINKLNPEVVKKLKKDSGFGGFTFEQALRVWLFQKAGHTPNGLNEQTQARLIEIVKQNPDIQKYGEELSSILGIEPFWIEPDPKNWQVDTIKSDMVDVVEKVSRKALLEEWIQNKNEIFSDNNMNKIEATYGPDFRAALEDMLYRMENGTSRPEGTNKQMNQFLNWVRGSVAVTMFFNTRSAILQQISLINFLNWGDNNPIKAAAALANVGQYTKDWAFIFNSDYLKERRGGLKTDVDAADLAEAMRKGGIKGLHARLLQLGFSLTQIGDSFAIATGGATFLRNRINTYISQGMDAEAAQKQAFLDFQEISEESQQSARPDRLAKQQTDVIGRVFLAFQNTPMQYTRIIVKAAKDLAAGRGDAKTNISKIVHYMVLQNIMFSAMQTALFSMLFDDDIDEEEREQNEKKIERIINNSVDTVVRGTGLYGAVLVTAKNMALKFAEQEAKQAEGKGRADHAYTLIEGLNISPAIGIKARQMYGSIQNYRYNKDEINSMGASLNNPVLDVAGSASAFALNVPLDRAISKMRNLKAASDAETETWAKIALALGWNTWNVGIENEELKQVKKEKKKLRAQQRKDIKKSGAGKLIIGKGKSGRLTIGDKPKGKL